MSRRRRATHRAPTPDARYNSTLVTHLINVIMKSGKKTIAERIVYGAFERMSEKLQKGDPVDLLMGALENARPKLSVGSSVPPAPARASRCARRCPPSSSMPTTTRDRW